MPRMLDLCSGLGGASEAFLLAGWDVVRIENNPLLSDVPNTEIRDILELREPYHFGEPFDLIWASPPCREFSNAYHAPGPKAKREGKAFEPDLRILNKCIEIIEYLEPKDWVIENVAGAIKIFTESLGPPRQIVGPFFLWGIFPFLEMNGNWSHSKEDGAPWSTDPLRSNKRGKIPLEVSTQLLRSLTQQKKISEWY
jgi:hypothetical protein